MKRVYDIVFSDNTKRCGRCGKIKPTSEFNINSTRKCGFANACKECSYIKQKEYRKTDSYKIKSKISKKKYRDLHYEESWVDSTLGRHKAAGYIINITRQQLIRIAKETKKCELCGELLDWSINKKKMKTYSPTLDRINNEIIMTMDNTQIICNRCNKSKGTMPQDEFIEYCRKIALLKKSDE